MIDVSMRSILVDEIKIIRKYLKVVEVKKTYLVGLFLLSATGTGLSMMIPVYSAMIIEAVTKKDLNGMYAGVGCLAVMYVLYNLAWFLNYQLYAKNHRYIHVKTREILVDKILSYDTNFFDKVPKGLIINTTSSGLSEISATVDDVVQYVVTAMKIVVLLITFSCFNIWIGLGVLGFALSYVALLNFSNVKTAYYLAGQRRYMDKIVDALNQLLSGLSEIKLFNIQDKIKSNFGTLSDKWSDRYMKKRLWLGVGDNLFILYGSLGKVLLFLIVGLMIVNGKFEISVLVILTSYFSNLRVEIENFMKASRNLRDKENSLDRLQKILNYKNGEEIEFGKENKDDIEGVVKFNQVSYTYKTRNHGNVSNISFIAEPNQITALVGHSGSGKSTLANLLLRRYKADKGKILIDGRNILRYSEKIYSSNVAAVDQTPFMFNMSIRKNLGLIDNRLEEQIKACKRVGIHDYIVSLPNGYNTVLTENASNFSGGQKQLLAIARTLLSDAEILVFDEVTSALDTKLAEKMKCLFDDLKQDHTIILVTHKRDVMRLADKIIVMDHGRKVGEGTHKQLMKNNQYYIDIQTTSYVKDEEEDTVIDFVVDNE